MMNHGIKAIFRGKQILKWLMNKEKDRDQLIRNFSAVGIVRKVSSSNKRLLSQRRCHYFQRWQEILS